MTTCIGIICTGERYIREFEETFKPSVVKYAARHGYDLKIFTSYLDPGHAHPDCISFQKCLVPEALKGYDTVVVMDADIWMSDQAPRVPDCGDKIGIVNEVLQPEYSMVDCTSSPTPYYALCGFDIQTNKMLNTGFMICKPEIHANFLRQVYDKHIDKAIGHYRKFHYEQSCIGYELQVENMFVEISNSWNLIYIFHRILKTTPPPSYGLHFAGLLERSKVLAIYLTTGQLGKRILRWGIH
jgi:hypothetical protein